MPDDKFDEKGNLEAGGAEEDSSAEMDIIKDALSDEPVQEEKTDVFSVDLFGQGGADEQSQEESPSGPQPQQEARPQPQDDEDDNPLGADPNDIKIVTDSDLKDMFQASGPGIGPSDEEEPPVPEGPEEGPAAPEEQEAEEMAHPEDILEETTPATPQPAEAEPPPPPPPPRSWEAPDATLPEKEEQATKHEQAKELLEEEPSIQPASDIEEIGGGEDDDSLEEQIEESIEEGPQPGGGIEEIGLDEAEAAEDVEVREPAAREEEIEEIGDSGPSAEEEPPAPEAPASASQDIEEIGLGDPEGTAPAEEEPPEESPDELVEELEEKAEVGDMTAVAAGKKGDLLEQTEHLVHQLEPSSEDFMSVDELKKLFNNVNLLIRLMRSLSERIDKMEEDIEKLKL